ncbi:uncharacterized protein LOC105429162 [Pogonomyrmex barbatus]|uniref:Uncharacterized protein LOC105429162 n=1 Tax=Pogonomyrmex barbatus TaxID=144034 RepID=A0A8N1S6V9_9HYME|nr:uncharacterized protein LOC105429162 [Pogonomyrmex barbatus]
MIKEQFKYNKSCFFQTRIQDTRGESFCSSDLSLDGTDGGFDIGENDGGGADGSHQGASHSHHGSSSHDTPSLSQSLHAAINNPIDKLFMMQSSYFSGDHA